VPSPPVSLTTLLAELAASGVEFILVGGLAAVAQGAPVTTHDIDIVPHRTADNIDVLCQFLRTHSAQYRGRPDRLEPAAHALLGTGHHLLSTDLGPLDVLGAIEGGRDYEALIPHAITIDLDGRQLRVLSLEMLAELKRLSPHPKDKLMLAILEAMITGRS
jgi:hypothetical protein